MFSSFDSSGYFYLFVGEFCLFVLVVLYILCILYILNYLLYEDIPFLFFIEEIIGLCISIKVFLIFADTIISSTSQLKY